MRQHVQRPAGTLPVHGNTRRTRRLIATGDQRSGDCADLAAGQVPVAVVSMPRYSLNTRSNRKPATRNTVVSGPTKASAQTSAVAGVRAVLATALATGPARPVRPTSYAEPRREAHR